MMDTGRTTQAGTAGLDYGIAPEGRRLPAETVLGPVRLQVADIDRSLEYYQGVLGLRVVNREEASAELAAHEDDGILVSLREKRGAAPTPYQGRLGLYHFAILLPSRGDLGRFLRHLAERNERAGAADHLVSEALYLRDPDGLGIEVYADRPRTDWRLSGREVRMVTDPLDAEGVLRAAGDTPWAGMPPGTTMGHVHLHVGDLEQAASFYHQGLGLDKMVWTYPGALFLSAGGYHHHLGLNTWAAGAPPPGDTEAKLLEWTVELPDAQSVAATAAGLEGAGYHIVRAPAGEISTRDPWGTALRLRKRLR